MTRPHYITPPIEESFPLFAVRRIDTPIAAARRSDPATSHAAAATAPVAEHQAKILEALTIGPAGASVIGQRCGLDGHQVGRRIKELEASGQIVQTGRLVPSSSGRGQREWQIN
jgi:hypothetical protein